MKTPWKGLGALVFGLGMAAGMSWPGGDAVTAADAAPAAVAGPPARPALQAAAAEQADVLRAILDGLGAATPAVCELALMALDGRSFGWSAARADVESTDARGVPIEALAGWVMRPPRDAALVPPLRQALTAGDGCPARGAARLLGRMGTEPAIDALRSALASPEASVRRNALLGLGLAEGRGTGPAVRAALRDGDASVRAAAAWALGQLEDRAAVPDLARLLGSDRDPRVRRAAARALGRIE